MRALIHRIRMLVRRSDVERAMNDEMRHHLECETAENIAQGMPPADARRKAMIDFGGVERFKEAGRDERGGRLAEDLASDLRYAVRVLVRNRGFTVAAVLTFALGLGAVTAIFSVVRGVLLRPLPYRNPSELVVLWETKQNGGGATNVVSVATFEAWQARSRQLSGIAALVPAPVTAITTGDPERITGVQVSPGYFRLLGIAPALGREFTADEGADGGLPVVILSHAYWERRWGSDPGAVGRTVSLDGKPHLIIGVMPRGFTPPRFGWIDDQDVWLPFGPSAANRSWGHVLHVVGRVRPGTTTAAAIAEVASITEQRGTEAVDAKGWSATGSGLAETITGDVRRPLSLLLAGAVVLLAMAIANVANLSIGLARRRETELAVRRAIGASSGRLFRQLVTQSAVLGIAGCIVGLGVGMVSLRALLGLMPASVPHTDQVKLDWVIVACAMIVTLATTVVLGALSARGGKSDRLSGTAAGRTTARIGGGSLVVVEIALATLLTILAALMVRTFTNLRSVDLGYDARGVVAGRIALTGDKYATAESQRLFFDGVLERLRAMPGVTAATLLNRRPFRGGSPSTTIYDPAVPPVEGSDAPISDIRFADSTLFDAMRMKFVAGHPFPAAAATTSAASIPVVVSQSAVAQLGYGASPIGRRVQIKLNGGLNGEIVGVVADAYLVGPRTPPRSTVYLPRIAGEVYDIMVRVAGDPALFEPQLRAAITATDPALPLFQVQPLEALVDQAVERDRLTTMLLSGFSLLALLLAGVGIFGVFSADVSSRRREIGIRQALGAGATRVVRMVIRRALARAGIGIAIGLALASAVTRLIATLLFGVGATDPLTFVAVAAVLFAVAVLATLVPASSAARVSPLVAIRSE